MAIGILTDLTKCIGCDDIADNVLCSNCHPKLFAFNLEELKKQAKGDVWHGMQACGACHNGEKAFKIKGHCGNCHAEEG